MIHNWNNFIDECIETELRTYRKTTESRHRQTIETQMDEMLDTNLTNEQKTMVEDVLFAKACMQEQDGKRLYQQGMRDCVAVLKNLGVLG